jgi:NHLM bacteriocin system ABC transporter ATP-binding protein
MNDTLILESGMVDSSATQALSGKTPLLLIDPTLAWLILEGRAELYAVRVCEDRPLGARRHLCTLTAGDLIISPGLSDKALALQVVGMPGTRVARLEGERLLAWSDGPAAAKAREALAKAIDRCLVGLCAGLTRDITPKPNLRRELVSGQFIDLDESRVLRPSAGVWWLRRSPPLVEVGDDSAGAPLYLGIQEVAMPASSPTGVLTAQTWIVNPEAGAKGRAELLDTPALLAIPGWLTAFGHFATLFFQCLDLELRLADVDSHNAISSKVLASSRSRVNSLEQLKGVLREEWRGAELPRDYPLAAASAWVAKAAGIELPQVDFRGDERVADIASSWGIQHRPVTLRGKWWRRDGGPLLGFWNDGEIGEEAACPSRPVALLQPKPGCYLAHDPATRRSFRVSAALAKTLSAKAISFYRPFPGKPLGFMDLFRHATLGSRRDFLFFLYSGIVIALLAVLPPVAVKVLFSDVIPAANRTLLGEVAALLTIVAIAVFTLGLARLAAVHRLNGRMDFQLEPALWERLISLPVSFHRGQGPGELADKADGLNAMRLQLSGSLLNAVLSGVFATSNIFMLFVFSPQLAMPALGMLLLGALAGTVFNLRQLKSWRDYYELQGRITAMLVQFFSGIAKIRMSGAEDQVFSLWAVKFAAQQQRMLRAGREQNILLVFNMLFPLATMMVLFYFAASPPEPMVNTGSFLAFLAAYLALQTALLSISSSAVAFSSIFPLYQRLKPILETLPEQSGIKADPGPLMGKIELAQVHFSYGPAGPDILNGVNLEIKPGEFVALVGPSGSGKSTILRLLLGFENPTSGSVRYDDRDLKDLDIFKLRQRHLGVVLQDDALLPGDIRSNILGLKNLSLEDAWEAARRAGLEDDIKLMPMGMSTPIGEGGTTLSGGQRQRLAIARALAGNPTILLLDEATSALDNQTQSTVSAALDRLRATRVVVAHRLSTVRNADRILVLDAGRIIESGNYRELMESQGRFHALVKRQVLAL